MATLTQTEIADKLTSIEKMPAKAVHALLEELVTRNSPVTIPDAAAYTVLAVNSGRDHIFPGFTASCTATLPAAEEGLRFRFIGKGGAADAENFLIDTGPTENFLIGGVLWLDNDSATDNVAGVFSDGTDDDVLTIVTPDAGTVVELYCDGTNWIIIHGIVVSATTPTIG
jgi:hypothetical protein